MDEAADSGNDDVGIFGRRGHGRFRKQNPWRCIRVCWIEYSLVGGDVPPLQTPPSTDASHVVDSVRLAVLHNNYKEIM